MIRARFVGSTLRVSPAPMTLVLDGTHWDLRQRDLAAGLVSRARRVAADVTLVFWSDGARVGGVPGEGHADDHALQGRGRFVTPLIESGAMGGGGSLVCLLAGRVPDWTDWIDHLAETFPTRLSVLLRPGAAALPGSTAVDAVARGGEMVESEIADATLSEGISSVSLHFEGCVPVSLPPDFALSDTDEDLTMRWQGEVEGLEVGLAVACSDGRGRIRAEARGTAGTVTRARAQIPCSAVPRLRWTPLGEESDRLMAEALRAYEDGTGEHQCLRCGDRHAFARAFRCTSGGRAFFADASGVSLPPECAADPGSHVLFRVAEGRLETASSPAGSVFWVGGYAVVRGRDEWTVMTPDARLIGSTPEVWPGLSGGRRTRLWIVSA